MRILDLSGSTETYGLAAVEIQACGCPCIEGFIVRKDRHARLVISLDLLLQSLKRRLVKRRSAARSSGAERLARHRLDARAKL